MSEVARRGENKTMETARAAFENARKRKANVVNMRKILWRAYALA